MREDRAERLEQMLRSFEETRRRLDETAEAAARATGRGESSDGLVAAEVGPGGAVTALRIDSRALSRYDGVSLSRAVLEVIAAAQADLGASLTARYREVLGPGFDPASLAGDVASIEGMIRNVSRHLHG